METGENPPPLGDMMDDTVRIFFGTQKIRRAGHSQIIRLDNDWDLYQGEYVTLCVRKADMSDDFTYCSKKISRTGNSAPVVYLNRSLGYSVGDMVTFFIEKKSIPRPKGTDNPKNIIEMIRW